MLFSPIGILAIVAFTLGILVFIAILLLSKHRHVLNKAQYQSDFLAIEQSLVKNQSSTYALAVLEADKLLDRALIELKIPGRTLGERLKKCDAKQFSQLNQVWRAHKLRNQIAHEPQFKLNYATAKRALAIFRLALKDLGAI